jgi:hypothetical protein
MKQKSVKELEQELASLGEPQSTAQQAQQLALPPHVRPEDPQELKDLLNLKLNPPTAAERKNIRYDWDDELQFEERVVMVRKMLYHLRP